MQIVLLFLALVSVCSVWPRASPPSILDAKSVLPDSRHFSIVKHRCNDEERDHSENGTRPFQRILRADIALQGTGVRRSDAREEVVGNLAASGDRRGIDTICGHGVVDGRLIYGVINDSKRLEKITGAI